MPRLSLILTLSLLILPSGFAVAKKKAKPKFKAGSYCVVLVDPARPSPTTPRLVVGWRVDARGKVGSLLSSLELGGLGLTTGAFDLRGGGLKIDRRGRFAGRDMFWSMSGVFKTPTRITGTMRFKGEVAPQFPPVDTGDVAIDARRGSSIVIPSRGARCS